jgi:fructokinase
MKNRSECYGGIEAGGTKFVCAVGSGPDDVRGQVTFPTTHPQETVQRAVQFFQEQWDQVGPIAAIGIASFGPVDPDPRSPTYGYITTTPKPGWGNFNFLGEIRRSLNVPMVFDTDVNSAALGEWRWGAGQGLDTFLYLTVGTGIGGGVIANKHLIHGLVHPDMGHIFVPHDRIQDPFEGACPYHGDCLEGLACGPALARRWGKPAESLPPGHPAWELEAYYLASALASYIYTLSPQRIVLGGGVMHQSELYPLIRQKVRGFLNGYIRSVQILEDNPDYIRPPALGSRSGVLGALALAELALSA